MYHFQADIEGSLDDKIALKTPLKTLRSCSFDTPSRILPLVKDINTHYDYPNMYIQSSVTSPTSSSASNRKSSSPPEHILRPPFSRNNSSRFSNFSNDSSNASRKADRFAQLRDAIFYNTVLPGFILSADEKLCYPAYRNEDLPEEPVEIEDIGHYFKDGWDTWDEHFTRQLDLLEYPVVWLSRNRQNYDCRRVGLLQNGIRYVFEAKGECIRDPVTKEFVGGVTWFKELGEYDEVQRKDQDAALKSFETICEFLPHMIWTARWDGYVEYVSKSWLEYTGLTEQDDLCSAWIQVIHEEDRDSLMQVLENSLRDGKGFECHLRYRRYDGAWRWIAARASPFKDEKGKTLKMYGSSTDIHDIVVAQRESKRLETENARLLAKQQTSEESSRLKSQFLAHMSHELRTPIAGIIGMINLLSDTTLSAEQRDFADCVKTSADNLLTIVNDILDFSKIESGRLQTEDIPFTLSTIIDDLSRVWTHIAHAKQLSFSVRSNVPPGLRLLGDPTRIGQILSNLCSNALKFTTFGSISIDVDHRDLGEHTLTNISIQDTGIGIDDGVLKSLFEPFRQGDSSTARLHGGTGLGLIISRNLAELMGGHLTLESIKGYVALHSHLSLHCTDSRFLRSGTKANLGLPFRKVLPMDSSVVPKRLTPVLENNLIIAPARGMNCNIISPQMNFKTRSMPSILSNDNSIQELSLPTQRGHIKVLIVEDK